MSEMRPQLLETASGLLASGADLSAFAEAGFGALLVAEAADGIGGDWGDVVAILQLAGYHRPEIDLAPLMMPPAGGDARTDGALGVVALVAGALQRVMEMAIDHANVRVQFGKPLSKQQAVQQLLAQLAEEAAAIAIAAAAAGSARDKGDASFEIAAAKIRANRAAGLGAAIAHQVHGAIGFTQDHDLHRYTAALSRWRSAFGAEAYWAEQLGVQVLKNDGRGFWQDLTARSDD